ncbi:ribosomal protein S30-like protein [Sarcoptes scabiei]|uniref:Ribosomal protein S30-like protein n=1 Tax=Sarcoptes scabiei TaxID=52283 RepID=A0A132AB39_SARSC|nr:ribosomal protein S30-like protein [Sarcoptes scabiei]
MLISINLQRIILKKNLGAYPLKNLSRFSTVVEDVKKESNPSPKTEEGHQEDWFNVEKEIDIDERIVPKPISYRPDHLPQCRKRIRQKPWWRFRYFVDIHSRPLVKEEEYTEKPEYPPILEHDKEGLKKKIRFEWYNAIQRLPSAEEKIYEITKHYGHLSYIIEPVMKLYNSLPIQQHITRTHLIKNQLPDQNEMMDKEINYDPLKQMILTLIESRLFHTESCHVKHFKQSTLSVLGRTTKEIFSQSCKQQDLLADIIQIVRNFKQSHQSSSNTSNVQIDYNPFVATTWWVNDFPIPFKKKYWFRDQTTWNQCFAYRGNHACHVRTEMPLAPIVSIDNDVCMKSEVPQWNHNLLRFGIQLMRRNIYSLPGFWPSHSNGFDFPYLLGHSYEMIEMRKKLNIQIDDDIQDVLDGMAITSAFGWLTSIANNLGFTIYDHLTYPLVTNVIITDGQWWSFYWAP